jgi:hypothetical protein
LQGFHFSIWYNSTANSISPINFQCYILTTHPLAARRALTQDATASNVARRLRTQNHGRTQINVIAEEPSRHLLIEALQEAGEIEK